MRKFGLIGRNISYSFSQNYFSIKFKDENILDATYQNFDIQSINQFKKEILATDHLAGLNVTIPFKEEITIAPIDKASIIFILVPDPNFKGTHKHLE